MDRLQVFEVCRLAKRLWRRYELIETQAAAEKIILDPKYHDVLTLVKGIRNGIVYGTKVRFPHALV
jgi:hypothetical protein